VARLAEGYDRSLDIACICSYMDGMVRTADLRQPKTSGCTCLRLRKASRCVSQIYDRYLEPEGLTVTQYAVLGHLAIFDGICVGALAEKLIMDPTTLTRNLRPLMRQDFVVLESDPRDRRSRRLHLTAKGRGVFERAKPAWARAQRHIETALGELDTPTLNTALDHVVERLAE
jgi:DNA-binding MarR family transcriptional regulator